MKLAIPGLLLASILVNVWLLLRPAPPAAETKCPECPSAETTVAGGGNPSAGSFGSVPAAQAASPAENRLRTMGEDRLRADWMRDRDKNIELLRKGFSSKEFQDKELHENAARLVNDLGLTKLQADTFTRRYRDKRMARVAEAQQAIDKQPPDYSGLAAAVRGLFADEDALAKQIAGDAALQKMQAAELDTRVSLLGTTVVWASEPFSKVEW